jgi:hypothetical protein
VELTDRIIAGLGLIRSGPGQRPEVTDAELACLAVAQVLLRFHRAGRSSPTCRECYAGRRPDQHASNGQARSAVAIE